MSPARPAKDVVEILRASPAPKWQEEMIRTEKGSIRPLLANALTALRKANQWAGVLAYDEFSLKTVALKAKPWGGAVGQWCDNDDRLVTEWLQSNGIYISVEVGAQAAQVVAQENAFHPVRSYLTNLEWDGIPRIHLWLRDYLGVEDSVYSRAVGSCWLISGVARILTPGAKADCCLILEGPQGIGKSRSLSVLGGQWFTDEIADLGSKDASMQLQGVWIIELAELDSLSRGDICKIKATMSRPTDRFRPPYGKRLIESPRQCIFAGSVNHGNYLRDETGARRFWPVVCTKIALQELAAVRDQLWAEAIRCYQSGDPWWLDSAELVGEAAEEQAARFEGDPWDRTISAWIAPKSDVSIDELLGKDCLNKDKSTWSQSDKVRVARILRSLGWERYKARVLDVREWRYRPVDT